MNELGRLTRQNAGLEATLADLIKAQRWWMLVAKILGALFGAALATAVVDPITILPGCGGIETQEPPDGHDC